MTLPQLGPLLGRLCEPGPQDGERPPVTALRLSLVDALLEQAGVARDLAAGGDLRGARDAMARPVWVSTWRDVASRMADLVERQAEHALAAAAAESRYPSRRLAARRSTAVEEERFRSRCEAAGIPIEQATELPQLAAATEEAWASLLNLAAAELANRLAIAGAVRSWRRPRRPLWVLSAAALLAAVLAGAALGGFLPVPDALQPVVAWWWSLPWP